MSRTRDIGVSHANLGILASGGGAMLTAALGEALKELDPVIRTVS